PACLNTMDESTEKLIKAYVEAGGKVLLDGDKPQYLTWKPYSYDYLCSNTTYEEIEASRGFNYTAKGGRCCINPRNAENGKFIYILNHSLEENCEVVFDFGGEYTAFERNYPNSDKTEILPLGFTLQPGESALLTPVKAEAQADKLYEVIIPDKNFMVMGSDLNSLTIDTLRYSKDGENFSEPIYTYAAFSKLLNEQYAGDIYLKYEFETKTLPVITEFDVTLSRVKEVYINGTALGYKGAEFHSGNVAEFITEGLNEIVIKIDYFQNDNVYYVLFGENVTESLKNCLVYDSEFEPLVIRGDFGVYEKNGFRAGEMCNVRLGSEFVLDTLKPEISTLVDDGYAFFAGKIILSQEIECSGNAAKLKLPGRWHSATVKLNDKVVGTLLTEDTIDVSDFVVKGKNKLEIKFIIGNRNLYGPHHFSDCEEPVMTSPFMFQFITEEEAKSFRSSSAFVEPLYRG
ncbi:MAG: hypothetical protein IKK24_04605, partial [Clostridia bacterium]|nr:hypothetical protein [Clostridia bacterium]